MEIKNLLNKWTIGMNIAGLLYVGWLHGSGILEALWGALFVLFLVCPLYLLSLIHLFYVENLKDKFMTVCADIFPVLVFLLYGGFFYSQVKSMSIGILLVYILPIIIITFLSHGLTSLWRKFRK